MTLTLFLCAVLLYCMKRVQVAVWCCIIISYFFVVFYHTMLCHAVLSCVVLCHKLLFRKV